MIQTSLNHLRDMQAPNGLFRASRKQVSTGYDRIWIRDNLYISIAFDAINDTETIEKMFLQLINLLIKFEWKIDEVIKKKPKEDYKFLHPLYTENLEEIKEGWGWKQNDTIGGLLYFIGYYQQKGYKILKNQNDDRIIKKLVQYLESIQYWEDRDNGMWEENKEVHSSSVGACVAGLKQIQEIIKVPPMLIQEGEKVLNKTLPKESELKNVDLALLSLIYPYMVIDDKMAFKILDNVKKQLVKKKGVIRYSNDKYYFNQGKEASWTMGFPWMAICYYQLDDLKKYQEYMKKTVNTITENVELPELYIQDSIQNENTPLGWSQSLLVKSLTL